MTNNLAKVFLGLASVGALVLATSAHAVEQTTSDRTVCLAEVPTELRSEFDNAKYRACRRFLASNPGRDDLARAAYNVGYMFLLDRNNLPAITYFSMAIEAKPDFARAYYVRGLAYTDFSQEVPLGKEKTIQTADLALADFREAARLDPHLGSTKPAAAQAYYNRAQAEDANGAIADLTEAIKLEPRNASYPQARGDRWVELDQYDKALRLRHRAFRRPALLADVSPTRATLVQTSRI